MFWTDLRDAQVQNKWRKKILGPTGYLGLPGK